MKDFIVRTNDWYENLKEPKKSLFYLSLTLIPFFTAVHFGVGWYGIGWLCLIVLWRMLHPVFK